MKQHITIEDLNQLSDKGKEKLWIWWKPVEGDCCTDGDDQSIIAGDDEYHPINKTNDNYLVGPWHPLLSIGQMIEFLDQQDKFSRIDRDEMWEVQVPKLNDSGEIYAWNGINKTELCDALWEQVKEVLEKDAS